jgi:hypothetical protein
MENIVQALDTPQINNADISNPSQPAGSFLFSPGDNLIALVKVQKSTDTTRSFIVAYSVQFTFTHTI